MKRPPVIMKLRIDNRDKKINLWLPLFLIFPLIAIIAAAIFIILSPFLLIAAIVLLFFGWGRVLLLFFPVVLVCIFALRGLEVDVKQDREKVFISFD